jgi:hypothetical protein
MIQVGRDDTFKPFDLSFQTGTGAMTDWRDIVALVVKKFKLDPVEDREVSA